MARWFKQQNWKSVVFIWLSVIGVVTGMQIVGESLDNRSSANNKEVSGVCNLENFEIGSEFLCSSGKILWEDKLADDGEYNWWCVDNGGNLLGECFLKKEVN